MSKIEKRKEDRYVPDLQSDGKLFLRAGDERVPIRGIKDVSSHGISIALDGALAVSDQVAIEYVDSRLRLEVYGTVAWCVAAEGGSGAAPQLAGIELLSPLMLAAMVGRKPVGIAVANGWFWPAGGNPAACLPAR